MDRGGVSEATEEVKVNDPVRSSHSALVKIGDSV
jgi:hypothetical protein